MADYLDFPVHLPAPMRRKIRLVIAGAALIVLGVVLFFTHILVTLVLLKDPTRQVRVPGETAISITDRGDYTVFHEYRSVFEGTRYMGSPQAKGLLVEFSHPLSGERVQPEPVRHPASYSSRAGKGVSLYTVHFDRPGEWRVHAFYDDEAPDPRETVLAIRRWSTARAPLMLLRSWAILLLPAGLGAFLIYRGLWRRAARHG